MQYKTTGGDHKPIVGISTGDYNGIGPEIILKTLADNRISQLCTPVIYGSMKIFSKYRKILGLADFPINQVNQISQIAIKKVNLVNIQPNFNAEINPGQLSKEAGQFAFESLKASVNDLKQGSLHALVTAPIHKFAIQSEEFQFTGHTDYLAQAFGLKEVLMMMVSEQLKVALVTDHIPISEVSKHITRERIFTKCRMLLKSLKEDFGISKPKIAVLGVNPHAGEEGLLGDEEMQILRPAILEMKKKGSLIYGPFPADGFFAKLEYKKFDAVLAMYHDQGLVPFKTLAFEEGVNFTAGLPAVRTSPDHGTAFSIAGKNEADESSFRSALLMACEVVKNKSSEKVEVEEN